MFEHVVKRSADGKQAEDPASAPPSPSPPSRTKKHSGRGTGAALLVPDHDGAYRSSQAIPGGLPLPRMRRMIFATTIVIGVASALGILLSVVGFARGDAHAHWQAMKEGGIIGMCALFACAVLLPLALALPAILMARGKRVPSGVLLAIAMFPVIGSALLTLYRFHSFSSSGLYPRSPFDRDAAAILIESVGETMNLSALGAVAGAAACLVVGSGGAGALASIDRRNAGLTGLTKQARHASLATLMMGGLWTLATIVFLLVSVSPKQLGFLSIASVIVVAFSAVLAVGISRGASLLPSWHDPIEAKRHAAFAFVAGIACVSAVCLIERAEMARVGRDVLVIASYDAMGSDSKRSVVADLLPIRLHAAHALYLHLILGSATFLLGMRPAIGRVGADGKSVHPFGSVLGIGVGALVLAILLHGLVAIRQAPLLATEYQPIFSSSERAP